MFCLRNKVGQVTPFMLGVIAILIVALMITVNIGKVGLIKTNTQNAADAGALAGASLIANGLNSIRDYSDIMMQDWITAFVVLVSCKMPCLGAWVFYGAHLASQIAMYVMSIKAGDDACKEAKKSAVRIAFNNIGVDESKPRIKDSFGSWETYEQWSKRDSNFSKWMSDEEFMSEDTYSWGEGKKNSATVKYKGPDGLTPVPLLSGLVINCWIPFVGCIHQGVWLSDSGIAWADASTPIEVTTERVAEDKDFGIWKMRYHKEGESKISSYAKAKAFGGSVLPLLGKDYDSHLVDTR